MPWARREAGQPAEALPAPFQTSRSSCGCCSCTTRTCRSGRTAAGHAAAAHPAGDGGVEALRCRAAQTSHSTHGSSQLRQADELARPRRRRAGAGRRLPAMARRRRRRRSADAPRRHGGRSARRRRQHASARLMPRGGARWGGALPADNLWAYHTRVGLQIRGPANLAGAWSAQPVPASPRPPRAAHRPAAARAPRTTPGCTCGHGSAPPTAPRPRANARAAGHGGEGGEN